MASNRAHLCFVMQVHMRDADHRHRSQGTKHNKPQGYNISQKLKKIKANSFLTSLSLMSRLIVWHYN